MLRVATLIIHSIVQLHRFVPVVYRRMCRKNIVTACFGRIFVIRHLFIFQQVELAGKELVGKIVEVILRIESMDMGQWLSIPFVLIGAYLVWRSLKQKK